GGGEAVNSELEPTPVYSELSPRSPAQATTGTPTHADIMLAMPPGHTHTHTPSSNRILMRPSMKSSSTPLH
uniref:Uncharacterized protein n=1 Tax=Pseudonaja textilis TaxID=8673 RepID=A0A670Z3G3_PSETE